MKIGNDIRESITIAKDTNKTWTSGPCNTLTLLCISLVWGHMLGLISIWFLPLTIISGLIGYGSEITSKDKPKTKITTLDL